MSSRKLHLNRTRDNNEYNLMAIHELLYSDFYIVLEAHMLGLLPIFNDFGLWYNFGEVSR